MPNSYPNGCVPSREAVCTNFMDFGIAVRAGTHVLPHTRRTCLPLSFPAAMNWDRRLCGCYCDVWLIQVNNSKVSIICWGFFFVPTFFPSKMPSIFFHPFDGFCLLISTEKSLKISYKRLEYYQNPQKSC